MNAEQFSKYLSLIDHPTQLNLAVDEQSLFFLYKQHLSRFPYQNVHLYNGEQVAYTTVNKLLILKLMPISVTWLSLVVTATNNQSY